MKSPRNKIVHSSASYRLYLHLVWPTKYRKHILGEKLTPVVESKILEVCRTKQYHLFVVKAAVDHIHVLLGMRPTQAVSDVVKDLKTNSSAAAFATFSRLSEIIKMDVLWAEGYRAESVSPGELERVRRYIKSSAKPSIIAQNSDFELGRMRNTSTTVRLHPNRKGGRRHETPTADAVGIEGKSCSVPLAHASGWRLFGALHIYETSSELVGREEDFESQPKACVADKNGATSPQRGAVKQLATGEETSGRTAAR